jgi:hypothetical protein
MDSTDGLVRGQEVTDTGAPISVPVGPETLGRILNVIGEPIDERGPVNAKQSPIHRRAPEFVDQSTGDRDSRHRHQGHRPARPLRQGRQDRPVRRRRRRQDRAHQELINNIAKATAATRCSPASASAPARATTSITS